MKFTKYLHGTWSIIDQKSIILTNTMHFLAIATNIPVLLRIGFVVQGHNYSCCKACWELTHPTLFNKELFVLGTTSDGILLSMFLYRFQVHFSVSVTHSSLCWIQCNCCSTVYNYSCQAKTKDSSVSSTADIQYQHLNSPPLTVYRK